MYYTCTCTAYTVDVDDEMKVHQTLEWLNLLSLGTKGLKPHQQSVYNQNQLQMTTHYCAILTLSHQGAGCNCILSHCCQIPSGLLGQFSQKNSAAGEKIRPQAGHPPNHQKKCSKKFLLQIFGPVFANYC